MDLRRSVGGRWSMVACVAGALLVTASTSSSAPRRTVPLDVSVAGEGVLTAAGGISCGERCDAKYLPDSVVELTAKPGNNETFDRWGGDCAGAALACSVLLERRTRVRAIFVAVPRPVRMTVGGPGTVVSDPAGRTTDVGSPAGIRCGSRADLCSATFGQGQTIVLTPAADADGEFAGWGGACEGQPLNPARCELTVGANEQVANQATAWFAHRVTAIGPQTLTVDAYRYRDVSSSTPGIDCGIVCAAEFAPGTPVTLSSADGDWSGDCVGTASRCTVVVDAPVKVVARYGGPNVGAGTTGFGLTVSVSKGGAVTGSKIRCVGPNKRGCEATVDPGKPVTLVAKPARNHRFVRWNDRFCSKQRASCTITMRDSRLVQAVFGSRRRVR